MKNKNLIRVAVLTALFAWPGIETYRYLEAKQAVAQSEKQLAAVTQQLAAVRAQQAPGVMKASFKPQE